MNVVVDTNVVAYYWIPGPFTERAVHLRARTGDWFVPRLWRSEFRSVLAGLLRAGSIAGDHARTVAVAAEAELVEFEREVVSSAVLDLVAGSRLSAYDCEFVSLAQAMHLPLVTEDTAILRQFPDVAVSLGTLTA